MAAEKQFETKVKKWFESEGIIRLEQLMTR